MGNNTSAIEVGGFSESGPSSFVDASNLSARIAAAYIKAVETPVGSTKSMWLAGPMFELKANLHDILTSNDARQVEGLLSDPGATDFLYGFEDNAVSLHIPNDHSRQQSLLAGQNEQVLQLAEALGVTRVRRAESGFAAEAGLEEVLQRLDDAFGMRIDFPNPYPRESGLVTGRGILTYRATQALYQAFRVKQLTQGIANPRILEIGAGSGRTAYYAWRMGLQDYTIVDLPLTCAASANFLGRALGAGSVSVYGEQPSPGVEIIPPHEFFSRDDEFDLVINVDSITEMARETADAYFAEINKRAGLFLSINHEANSFTARDLYGPQCISRSPFWMRTSYVEELVKTERGR